MFLVTYLTFNGNKQIIRLVLLTVDGLKFLPSGGCGRKTGVGGVLTNGGPGVSINLTIRKYVVFGYLEKYLKRSPTSQDFRKNSNCSIVIVT